MKRERFSEEKIIGILKESEAGGYGPTLKPHTEILSTIFRVTRRRLRS